jgi:hypothetical protein
MTDEFMVGLGRAHAAVQSFLDAARDDPGTNRRALAIARTYFETAFLWAANAAEEEEIFSGT